MRTSRQDYRDALYKDAILARCDSFQLKMDGWWSRTEIIGGELKVYTRTGRLLPDFNQTLSQKINATIIGELMYGTNWSQKPQLQGKVFAFDIWQADSTDLEASPYKTRYALLKAVLPFLPPTYIRVQNFDISTYDSVWNDLVATGQYEGVVFRRKDDTVGATLLRQKNVLTDEYTCLGILEGDGKHAGRCGSVVIGDAFGNPLFSSSGDPATVGGGFDDDEREDMFKRPLFFVGRKFEAEGRGRFPETNLLRHPNFVRWKDV
jgi:hypothetical protein